MKNAIDFIFKNKLYARKITAQRLLQIFKGQGFSIIEFSSGADEIVRKLGLSEKAGYYDCFTYIYNSSKFIFIKNGLTDRDKIILLLHEEGHIYLEHTAGKEELIHNTSVWKEWQANMFYLTVITVNRFCRYGIHLLSITLIIMIAVLFSNRNIGAITYGGSMDYIKNIPTETDNNKSAVNSEIVYYTDEGDTYHLYRACSYIKYVKNVKKGSIEQSKKVKCCSECDEYRTKEELLKLYGLPDFD